MNVNSPLAAGGSAPMTYYEGTMTTNVGGKSVVTPVEGLGGIKSSSVKVPVLSGDDLLTPSKVSNTILGVSGDQGVVGKIGQIRDIPPQIFEVSGKQVGSVPSTSGNILLVDTPLGKKAFTADVSYYATKTKPFADAELILGSAKMQRVGIDVSTPVLGTGYTQVGTIDTGLTGRAKVFDFGKIEFPEFVRTSKPSTSDVTVVGRQIRLTGFAIAIVKLFGIMMTPPATIVYLINALLACVLPMSLWTPVSIFTTFIGYGATIWLWLKGYEVVTKQYRGI